ncbi:hypothetical protein MOE15_04525 [Bacillus atrophaeus]|uniref:hypothetical protein n=1 Tax=Bacillus atrophaeus TaxID=1452 RepID=UPI002282B495|nr:hypothetical protein [Bacillus atrophaeus]MCY8807799.1 hypothetical protein [Bacillus atrophaeus]
MEEVLNQGEGETYFPDQPLKLHMKTISTDLMLFHIETQNKIVLPKQACFSTLLTGALAFFKSMDKVYDYYCHYELNKIKDLKNKIGGSDV